MKANIKLAKKYFPKKSKGRIDTVEQRKACGKNNDVLFEAWHAWSALDSFREKARRNKEYTFGDQWKDKVWTKKGWMTERQHILNQGNIPFQNNRIRSIVRSVSGVFQSMQTEPVCVSRDREKQTKGEMMSATVQYVYQLNKMWGLDSSNFQYFLIAGLACFRSTYGWREGKMDVWTDIVNHNRLFFRQHEDPRHWDCNMIGEIHDIGLYDAMAKFSDGSKAKAMEIRQIYSACTGENIHEYYNNLTDDSLKDLNFLVPKDSSLCRVIEIWRKESKERIICHDTLNGDYYKIETSEVGSIEAENQKRIQQQAANGIAPEDMRLIKHQWFIDNYWHFYFMSPQGDVLKEGETPYWHGSHPYSIKIYPFYDGQIFPFVSDFIDQQRYINRLIITQEFVMRASAKGVLLFPEGSLPDNYKIEDIAEEWAVYNGVIMYKAKQGVPDPKQIIANSSQTGIYDMLQIQLKLLEDVSGVQGALQGKTPAAGTPASLYSQQMQNAATSLTELFESYKELRETRDFKNMKLIQQFYTEPRYININGSNARPQTMVYEPKEVRNAEFDLSITESSSTPSYRLVMNDFLMQLFQAGQISLNELLENGAFPFADKLLQAVKSRQEEAMSAGGQGDPMQQGIVPPEVQGQLNQKTNPLVQQMLNYQNAG